MGQRPQRGSMTYGTTQRKSESDVPATESEMPARRSERPAQWLEKHNRYYAHLPFLFPISLHKWGVKKLKQKFQKGACDELA